MSSPATWSELSPSQLARLAELARFIHGRTGERELLYAMPGFYPHFAERVAVGQRREVFARLSTYAREQEVQREALTPFPLCDDDPEIVSQAAHDLALYREPSMSAAPDGPEQVFGLVLKGGLINPGAALAGLLQLGDPDVCARIGTLRPIRAGRELNHTLLQLVTCADGPVHLATVLFDLEWLEMLSHEDGGHAFGHVASGLVILGRAAGEVIIDGRRRFPLPKDPTAAYLPGMRVLSVRDVARRMAPHVEAIARREPAPHVVPRVLEAWQVTES